jgi:hypothetical protein
VVTEQPEAEAKAQTDKDTDVPAEQGQDHTVDQAYSSGTYSQDAILNDEIRIDYDKRLQKYDRGPVQAFVAKPIDSSVTASLFALICERHLIPRASKGPSFANIVNTSLARLVGSGPVYWPPAQGQVYAFIYQDNLGDPIMTPDSSEGLGLKHDVAMNTIIRPLVNVLLDLRDADLAHGSINPFNMFNGGNKNFERVILGECLATPPSFTQPTIFESIERALCDPIARAIPRMEDDLYAFGVSLAVILRHKNPLEGLSDEEIIKQKIELGSYAAITGKDRFTGAILELLRGLLYDDRAQRWTIEDVMAWLDGQRLTPKQSAKKTRASRPIYFEGERYFRPSLLAMDLTKNPAEAIQAIDNEALETWITRSLEDNLTANRFESAIEIVQQQGRGAGYWDKILARVCIALDPDSPIRYKGANFHPEGISSALAEALVTKKDLSPFIDIINYQMVSFWLNSQNDIRVDIGSLSSKFDSCRAFLRQEAIGYGIERCLYFLNPECPCLSKTFERFYIRSPEEFMSVLEEVSGLPNRPDLFLDRHSAAFLSVKERKVIDPFLHELNSKDYHAKVMANVKVLATIQKRSKLPPYKGICSWIKETLDPVYERFHDRLLRDKLKERVKKYSEAGDISKIAGLLDNPETFKRDFGMFHKAMQEYYDLREEAAMLEAKLEKPDSFGKNTGKEVAAIFSALLSGVLIIGFVFFFLVNGSPF